MSIVEQSISRPHNSTLTDPQISRVGESVLRALAYSDLFDYPLRLEEIARYQIETSFSVDEIRHALERDSALLRNVASSNDGFYCLIGRERVFDVRRSRAKASATVWRRARFFGAIMARFPFVRMLAVTGALAVDNLAARPDIDLLVVTRTGRVWLTRRLIVLIVRLARALGDDLCPNYIISRKSLSLDQRDLFTAHELAQMVPLYGAKVYREMLQQNDWAATYLPAAFAVGLGDNVPPAKRGLLRKGLERILSARPLDHLERWEMQRLRQKLRPLVGDDAEVVCSPDQCKGHTGLHRRWVTTRYEERLADLGFEESIS